MYVVWYASKQDQPGHQSSGGAVLPTALLAETVGPS